MTAPEVAIKRKGAQPNPLLLRIAAWAEKKGVRVVFDGLPVGPFEQRRWRGQWSTAPRHNGGIDYVGRDGSIVYWNETTKESAAGLAHEIVHVLVGEHPTKTDELGAFLYVEYLVDRKFKLPREAWMAHFGLSGREQDVHGDVIWEWEDLTSHQRHALLAEAKWLAIESKLVTKGGDLV